MFISIPLMLSSRPNLDSGGNSICHLRQSHISNIKTNDEKKGIGFLILPSRRRLRDYKNCIRPEQGFNPNIMFELRQKVQDFPDKEKFVFLLMD